MDRRSRTCSTDRPAPEQGCPGFPSRRTISVRRKGNTHESRLTNLHGGNAVLLAVVAGFRRRSARQAMGLAREPGRLGLRLPDQGGAPSRACGGSTRIRSERPKRPSRRPTLTALPPSSTSTARKPGCRLWRTITSSRPGPRATTQRRRARAWAITSRPTATRTVPGMPPMPPAWPRPGWSHAVIARTCWLRRSRTSESRTAPGRTGR